jgi:hypothetical protein
MITKSEAEAIAWRLVEASAKCHRFPFQRQPTRADLDSHDYGKNILGCASEFWAFIFRMDVPPGTQVHPDFVHVVVDPETGNAGFLPLK